MPNEIFIPLLATSIVLSIISLCIGIWVMTEVKAMQKSTHKVQYVPVDTPWDNSDNKVNEVFERTHNPDGTDIAQAGLDELNGMYEPVR